MFDLIIDGEVARLTLNRPEARNAIPLDGWDALAACVREAEECARALILAGAGGAFSAGADLTAFATFHHNSEAAAGFRHAMRRGIDALRDCAIPTIALVEGACYGAGVALAIACDIRIASPAAIFAITPAKLGISYPQEDIARLVALVGPAQASRLLLAAEAVDGAEAARIGLVERCDANASTVAASLAGAIASHDPDSIAALKRGIALAARGVASDTGQDESFDALLTSDALAERLRARRDARRLA
ncbi:enoyl-CoA hydratase/isomerase family protein [Allosphingosinicella indica]|uniref:Enoyl-CoA hydratase/carnithine racemase n=1 Tax=Allosphingosinicella indica TaxID=941907 RepID=A0A1X7FXN3_9SPHN|nr:enoyl-CoA hydratase/isomerase family protein [Allosphingosinicella indica]SMF60604.1 Enoyl-CoA hydratase/carnithine racemase [Allosphingosinicella indica]